MMRRSLFTTRFCLILLSIAISSVHSQWGWAQGAAAGSAPAPASGVSTVNQTNYLLDAGLVIVVFGAALYSVCRNSRRN